MSYGSAVVVFLDGGYPCFRNFYSTIPVDVVRVKSGRPMQDICKIQSKNMSKTSDLPVSRPPPFQTTLTTPNTIRFGTK